MRSVAGLMTMSADDESVLQLLNFVLTVPYGAVFFSFRALLIVILCLSLPENKENEIDGEEIVPV